MAQNNSSKTGQESFQTEQYTGDEEELITDQLSDNQSKQVKPESSPTSKTEISPLQIDQINGESQNGLKVIIVACLVFALSVTISLIITIYYAPPQVPLSGAVSSDAPECSVIGTDALKKGGSAVDAAVATVFCLGVVSPQTSGLNSGGVILIHQQKTPQKASHMIEYQFITPEALSNLTDSNIPNLFLQGGQAVLASSQLLALEKVHKEYGKLSWEELVLPSVKLARDGFNVSHKLAMGLANLSLAELSYSQDFKNAFTQSDNSTRVTAGEVLKRENYANTLEQIAKNPENFRRKLEQNIIDCVNTHSGTLSSNDFSKVQPSLTTAIEGSFNNLSIITSSALTGGPLLILGFNIVDTLNATALKSNLSRYHSFLEVEKLLMSQSEKLVSLTLNQSSRETGSQLLNVTFAKELSEKLTDRTHPADYYGPNILPISHSVPFSTSISIIGPDEELVTVTETIGEMFGSKIMTSYGVILNNAVTLFSPDPSSFNNVAASKRPFSVMAPVIVHAKSRPCGIRLALGSEISPSPMPLINVVYDIVMLGDNLKEAIRRPRLENQFFSPTVFYEVDLSDAVQNFLTSSGHKLVKADNPISVVNGVLKLNETVSAYSDFRNSGNSSVL